MSREPQPDSNPVPDSSPAPSVTTQTLYVGQVTGELRTRRQKDVFNLKQTYMTNIRLVHVFITQLESGM